MVKQIIFSQITSQIQSIHITYQRANYQQTLVMISLMACGELKFIRNKKHKFDFFFSNIFSLSLTRCWCVKMFSHKFSQIAHNLIIATTQVQNFFSFLSFSMIFHFLLTFFYWTFFYFIEKNFLKFSIRTISLQFTHEKMIEPLFCVQIDAKDSRGTRICNKIPSENFCNFVNVVHLNYIDWCLQISHENHFWW